MQYQKTLNIESITSKFAAFNTSVLKPKSTGKCF